MARKCFVLIVALLAYCSVAAEKPTGQKKTQFDVFIERFHLKYGATDYDERFAIFQKNLKKIEGFNQHSKSAKFAANKFAAMTDEEISHVSTDEPGVGTKTKIGQHVPYLFP